MSTNAPNFASRFRVGTNACSGPSHDARSRVFEFTHSVMRGLIKIYNDANIPMSSEMT
jgi:hypothetical protein